MENNQRIPRTDRERPSHSIGMRSPVSVFEKKTEVIQLQLSLYYVLTAGGCGRRGRRPTIWTRRQ
jgi:hypothetical protein